MVNREALYKQVIKHIKESANGDITKESQAKQKTIITEVKQVIRGGENPGTKL